MAMNSGQNKLESSSLTVSTPKIERLTKCHLIGHPAADTI